MKRTLAIAAFAAAMLLAGFAPTPASASASGCTQWTMPNSCVRIVGSGTYVQSVGGGVQLTTRQSARGYFVVYGGGLSFTSATNTYWNQSWWHKQTYWVDFAVGRELPNNTKICAKFVELKNGLYREHSPACKTVTR